MTIYNTGLLAGIPNPIQRDHSATKTWLGLSGTVHSDPQNYTRIASFTLVENTFE